MFSTRGSERYTAYNWHLKGCLVVLSSRVTTFTCPRGSQALGLFAGNNLLAVGISSEPGCFFSCYKETTIANHTRGFFRKQAGLDEGPQWCAEL